MYALDSSQVTSQCSSHTQYTYAWNPVPILGDVAISAYSYVSAFPSSSQSKGLVLSSWLGINPASYVSADTAQRDIAIFSRDHRPED